jgi:hypothetical protein
MGLTNFEQMLVDSNGNAYGVSGSMPLPVGAIGQLVAGVNPVTNIVEYLNSVSGSLLVTGSVSANVVFPADIVVSPQSPSGFWSAGPTGVTGSVNVYTSGPQAVSGTVSIVQPVQVWTEGPVGISASVALPVFNQGTVGVSGTVTVVPSSPSGYWFTGPVAVSGNIHTGSTANGFPVTVGGVYYGSGNVGSLPAYVQSIQVDPSGSVYITTTGSLPVTLQGNSSVSVNNFPSNQQVWTAGPVGVTGSVSLTSTAPLQVWTEGPFGVTGSVNVYTSGPQGISASVQLPVYSTGPIGVTASMQIPVYSTGIVGVSGTVSVTQPVEVWMLGTNAVSGTYQSGSVATAPIFPVLEGGLDTTNTVRPFLTDPQGRLTNPTTGSNVTTVAATTGNVTVLNPNPQRVGVAFFNEGSSTCFLKFGANATQSSYSVQLATKAYYELPFTYQGRIDATFSTNTGNLRVTELY